MNGLFTVKKGRISDLFIAFLVWAERLSPSVLSSLELYLQQGCLSKLEQVTGLFQNRQGRRVRLGFIALLHRYA